MEDNKFVKIVKISSIKKGEMKVFNMFGIEFLIYNKDNQKFYALYNKCPHMGGALSDGKIDESGFITCPLHNWQFSVEDGKAPTGYEDSVPTFEIKIKNDYIYVSKDDLLNLAKNKDFLIKAKPNTKERFARAHDSFEKDYENIQVKAKWKSNSIEPMRTKKEVRMFDDILFKAAQLFRLPLLPSEKVNMKTIIGKSAKKPLEISMPVFISHMSFGALSKEAKIALAKGASKMDTVMCSGEGGSHPDEFGNANKYIYEISAAKFTYNQEWIKRADAVEIKIGQSAKPGLGGHLPKGKITDEIAKLRGISKDVDLISPARYENIHSKEDLKNFVSDLKKLNNSKPVGIKFAAGHVEKDLEVALYANPDFITIDGRGGGTGAAPTFIKDNFAMPIVYAINRARRYLDKKKSNVTLIVTGGFRTSGEIAKALSMGADAIAIATTAMIAIGCEQYRACNTGECPVGIATQKQNLRDRFNIEESTNRLVNYLETLNHELIEITQAIGKNDIHKLDYEDIFTTSKEICDYTDVEHC